MCGSCLSDWVAVWARKCGPQEPRCVMESFVLAAMTQLTRRIRPKVQVTTGSSWDMEPGTCNPTKHSSPMFTCSAFPDAFPACCHPVASSCDRCALSFSYFQRVMRIHTHTTLHFHRMDSRMKLMTLSCSDLDLSTSRVVRMFFKHRNKPT